VGEEKEIPKTLEVRLMEERDLVIREIKAFAGDYSHNIDGHNVVRVDQLIEFLAS
jgi:hypothetical protein